MRRFRLMRYDDPSGVRHRDRGARVEFPDGTAAVHWPGEYALTTVWPGGVEHVRAIHGHDGRTELQWLAFCIDGRGGHTRPSAALTERLETTAWY